MPIPTKSEYIGFPNDVFDPANVRNKPEKSRFFLGQTVLHVKSQDFFTVCDLSQCADDIYWLWPLGYRSSIPTHRATGEDLEEVSQAVATPAPTLTVQSLAQ